MSTVVVSAAGSGEWNTKHGSCREEGGGKHIYHKIEITKWGTIGFDFDFAIDLQKENHMRVFFFGV